MLYGDGLRRGDGHMVRQRAHRVGVQNVQNLFQDFFPGSSPPVSRTRTSTSPGFGDVAFTSAISADADFAKYSYPPSGPAVE